LPLVPSRTGDNPCGDTGGVIAHPATITVASAKAYPITNAEPNAHTQPDTKTHTNSIICDSPGCL